MISKHQLCDAKDSDFYARWFWCNLSRLSFRTLLSTHSLPFGALHKAKVEWLRHRVHVILKRLELQQQRRLKKWGVKTLPQDIQVGS